MGLIDEIIGDYINRCKSPCNKGGYFRLGSVRESLVRQVVSNFNYNGYSPEEISGVVRFCDKIAFNYMDRLFAEKNIRIMNWSYVNEQELRERLANSFLPKA